MCCCMHVWGSAFKTTFNKLFIFQKQVIRLICSVPWHAHTVPHFHLLNVLNVQYLYEYNVGLVMYKYHQDMLPAVMDILIRNSDVHDYSTRQVIKMYLLHLPKYCTELAKRSFKYKATVFWNQLKTIMNVGCCNRNF